MRNEGPFGPDSGRVTLVGVLGYYKRTATPENMAVHLYLQIFLLRHLIVTGNPNSFPIGYLVEGGQEDLHKLWLSGA